MTDWARINAVLCGYPVPVPLDGAPPAMPTGNGWVFYLDGAVVMECPHRGCKAALSCPAWMQRLGPLDVWKRRMRRHHRRTHSWYARLARGLWAGLRWAWRVTWGRLL